MGVYTTHMTLVQYIKGCVFRRWEGYIKRRYLVGAQGRERGLFKLVVQILRAEEGCKQSVRMRYLTWLLIAGTNVQHVDLGTGREEKKSFYSPSSGDIDSMKPNQLTCPHQMLPFK